MAKIPGSCLCGRVKFEIKGEFESFYLCHCKYCQKDTGSAHGANLFSGSAALTWLSGKEKVRTFQIPSTLHIKSFCEECGSALPNLQMEGKLLVTPAGSLDGEITIKPNAHIFHSRQAAWAADLGSVKKFSELPS